MKLLAGYMHASNGKLSIDNQSIAKIRLDSYYPHIGYLTQEPSIFDGTIEENLLYGTKKNPSKKAIEKAIKLAECEFIYELEK
jgi:ABC-type multidrug transport system fused ATPase/permease subunit